MAKIMKVISPELFNHLLAIDASTETNFVSFPENEIKQASINDVLNFLNPCRTKKAKRLLDFLNGKISCNEKGDIYLNDERCPFSNIVDFIGICLRQNDPNGNYAKNKLPGQESFVNFLKTLNCPKSLLLFGSIIILLIKNLMIQMM